MTDDKRRTEETEEVTTEVKQNRWGTPATESERVEQKVTTKKETKEEKDDDTTVIIEES